VTVIGRTYVERGLPVTVLIQYGCKRRGESYGGPRNVLIERADGSRVVRPFRGLRCATPQPALPAEAREGDEG